MSLHESIVEDAAIEWLRELGYAAWYEPQLAPGEQDAEREFFGDVVLVNRLREAIRWFNPAIHQSGDRIAPCEPATAAPGTVN